MSSEVVLVIVIVAMAAVTVAAILKRSSAPTIGAGGEVLNPEVLLAPVREQIAAITSRLEKLAVETATSRTDFANKFATVLEESRAVFNQGAELRDTTTRISTALQGTGQRGNWGQVQLRRVVELAGLTKHVTFKEQVTGYTVDQEKLVPDLVVYLPDDRSIIVDSKAPNLSLDGATATASVLKDHIRSLSAKKYPSAFAGSMDFVVLFVPSEGTLAAALTEDPGLSEFSFSKNVLLATPMTLLGLLKAVEYGWRQLSQIENVALINKEAAELCDRVLKVLELFGGVQAGLATAVTKYNEAVASINSRLLPSVREMKKLGVEIMKDTSDLGKAPTQLSDLRNID
jgi:DNA recombination protein RmuC